MNPSVDAVLVDTDVYSYLMSGKNYAKLYLPHVDGKLMAISFVAVGELYFGAYRRKWGQERLDDLRDRLRSAVIVPYDDAVCKTYAEIKTSVESKGSNVSDNDLWIAACALRHAIPLVTNNRKHFDQIPGLVVISESQAMKEMQAQAALADASAVSGEPPQPSPKSSSASEPKAPVQRRP